MKIAETIVRQISPFSLLARALKILARERGKASLTQIQKDRQMLGLLMNHISHGGIRKV